MNIDNNFDDFDSVLTPKNNQPEQPASNSDLALSDINTTTYRLMKFLTDLLCVTFLTMIYA